MAEAEQFEPKKLASLTPPSPKKPEPADQNSYIQPVQLLLQKKGCYTGRIDGHWGPKSQEALIKALGNTASDAPIDEALVNRLTASKLTCPAQTVETDRFMSNVTVNKAAATKRKCLTFKECRTKCTSEGNNRCAVFCSGRGALGYRYGLCDQ